MAENFSEESITLVTSGADIPVNGQVFSIRTDVDWETARTCVYCYKTCCGKNYVGATGTSLRTRFRNHRSQYNAGSHMQLYEHFRNICKSCRSGSFHRLYVLETLPQADIDLGEMKKCYIKAFDSIDNGLNERQNWSGQYNFAAALLDQLYPEAADARRTAWRLAQRKRGLDPVKRAATNEARKRRRRRAKNLIHDSFQARKLGCFERNVERAFVNYALL